MNFSENIRLIQWNCCGVKGKLPQLQFIAKKVDIMCIQESMLWSNNCFWLKGFKVVRKDIVSPNQRGICILVREHLFSNIDLSDFNHPSWEIQGIILPLIEDSLAIVNIYRHPNQNTPPSTINQLLSALSKNYYKFIVGDFKAHHS